MGLVLLAAIYALFIPEGSARFGHRPNADDVRYRMCFLRPEMSSEKAESILGLHNDQMLVFGGTMIMQHGEYQIEPDCILTLFFTSKDGPGFYWQLKEAELIRNGVIVARVPSKTLDFPFFNRLRRLGRPAFERALALLPGAKEKISLLDQHDACSLLSAP